ncbi:O-antigen ligase [Mesorhizobium sp. BAC0120]|uniref:O-antigen ligase family protein n=1 Tax=Mesorhizobium sp. BAC0120 TaxID=3090670 RepID=UPI00298CBDC6|nr:O-antigen ligase [Mesorhizobium sp. BAC0120]MDW6022602.1 O-antigen ligase [Mesorhizobium sp. BAC0120]
MKIAKAYFVSPDRSTGYGVVAISISFFVFAYSTRFGQVSILAFYAVWFPLILVDYRQSLGNYLKFHWIIGFAVLACLSVFWSAAPGATARACLQYASHIVCALIAARTMSVRTLTIGALGGVSLVVLYSLAFGQYSYDPLDNEYTFVGAFASKNQLGFYASLGIYFAFILVFVLRERGVWRILAGICTMLSGYALLVSHSATSIISIAGTLGVMTGLGVILLFAPHARKGLLLFGIVVGFGVALIGLNAGGLNLLLGAFGKNTTLTGRTYLWQQGLLAWHQAPLLGVGYYAYWVQGFADAERLWQEFYITARTGFHFHNTYIETLVELGVVGLVLISTIILRVLLGHLTKLLDDRNDRTSYIMFGISMLLVVRSFFEVDVLNAYQVGSFLLYYAAGLLATPQRANLPAYRAMRFRPGMRQA